MLGCCLALCAYWSNCHQEHHLSFWYLPTALVIWILLALHLDTLGPAKHFVFFSFPVAERKLLLVVRHGQAISNYLSDTLGPDKWYAVEGTCAYKEEGDGKVWDIFDAGVSSLLNTACAEACSGSCVPLRPRWGQELGPSTVQHITVLTDSHSSVTPPQSISIAHLCGFATSTDEPRSRATPESSPGLV